MVASAPLRVQGELQAAPRGLTSWLQTTNRLMDSFFQLIENQWDAYPQWLVLGSLAITVAVGLWLLAKFVAWLFKVILIGTLIGVAVGLVIHFLG